MLRSHLFHSVDNLNYFSACTETILGGVKVYHVIILDYWLYWYLGLEHLAKKLCERFPNAQLFVVRNWSPAMFRRRLGAQTQTFKEWKTSIGLSPASSAIEVRNALVADTGDWFFPDRGNADRAHQRIKDDYGAMIVGFDNGGTKQDMLNVLLLFDSKQQTVLNAAGHYSLAQHIRHHVEGKIPDAAVALANQGFGSWKNGDRCDLWWVLFTSVTKLLFIFKFAFLTSPFIITGTLLVSFPYHTVLQHSR